MDPARLRLDSSFRVQAKTSRAGSLDMLGSRPVGLSLKPSVQFFTVGSVAPGRPRTRKNNRDKQLRLETCWHQSVGKVLPGPAHSQPSPD